MYKLWNLVVCVYCDLKFNHLINQHLKVDLFCPLCVTLCYVMLCYVMLQELNDVMKVELIADKQCSEIQQVRCYFVLACIHVQNCSVPCHCGESSHVQCILIW